MRKAMEGEKNSYLNGYVRVTSGKEEAIKFTKYFGLSPACDKRKDTRVVHQEDMSSDEKIIARID
jgi:hypothetical protein